MTDFTNSEIGRRSTAMNELHKIAHHSPIIHAFLSAWRHGDFATFEEMQTQLIVQLAQHIDELTKVAVMRLQVTQNQTALGGMMNFADVVNSPTIREASE